MDDVPGTGGSAAGYPGGSKAKEKIVAEIKNRLRSDLTTAMKARDAFAKSTIRMALGAIQYAEVAGEVARELSQAEEIAVITKEQRSRAESAQTYADAGRPELAAKESAEAKFLGRYLPQPLTHEQLVEIVDAQMAAAEAELGSGPTMRQMGAIVRAVNEQVAGRADGKTVAGLVKQRLG